MDIVHSIFLFVVLAEMSFTFFMLWSMNEMLKDYSMDIDDMFYKIHRISLLSCARKHRKNIKHGK